MHDESLHNLDDEPEVRVCHPSHPNTAALYWRAGLTAAQGYIPGKPSNNNQDPALKKLEKEEQEA